VIAVHHIPQIDANPVLQGILKGAMEVSGG
jgi:hypothetical protein